MHGDGNGNGGQISNPMQSSHEWPQTSISSFTSSGFDTSSSIGWPNSYQSAQLAQEQEWQADANRRSLQQHQAEQQALLAEAEQISKRFQSANQSSQSSSPEEVKTEQQATNPAIPDQTSSTLSPTKKAPRSKSAKSVKSAKSLEASVKKDAGAIESSSSDSAHKNTTNTKKRKFTPATVAVESQVQDDVVDSDGRHRYPCLHAGCGKTFSTSGHRARHARIHTGESNCEEDKEVDALERERGEASVVLVTVKGSSESVFSLWSTLNTGGCLIYRWTSRSFVVYLATCSSTWEERATSIASLLTFFFHLLPLGPLIFHRNQALSLYFSRVWSLFLSSRQWTPAFQNSQDRHQR